MPEWKEEINIKKSTDDDSVEKILEAQINLQDQFKSAFLQDREKTRASDCGNVLEFLPPRPEKSCLRRSSSTTSAQNYASSSMIDVED